MKYLFIAFGLGIFFFGCGEAAAPVTDTIEIKPKFTIERQGTAIKVIEFGELEKLLGSQSPRTRVFHFWASWCAPCLQELPQWNSIIPQYTNKEMEWYFVDISIEEDLQTKTMDFLLLQPNLRPVLHLNPDNPNEWVPKVHPDWQGTIPMTLIVKGEQKILIEKKMSVEELQQQLGNFLR
jgi:thiol-disulfide isomerase/thioredoxin